MAGITEIPAYIRVANDQEMLEMALVENIQRADLNAIEVAISYQRLMDECNLTHEALSDRVGKERSTISNYVRLLKLPPPIQAALKESKLSMGHARALAGIENIGLQLQMFHKCIDQHLSVRALESLIREYNIDKTIKQTIKNKPQENPEVQKFKQDLSNLLGSKVDIKKEAVLLNLQRS
jgi:ParB family chromosome partitioning protein